jgi:glycosyltransferase involved in cell wall biosynthesis
MESFPRITIVTPCYNPAKYIAETIDSVVAQDYPNLQHIVIDGGSTDGTLDILKRYPHLIVVSEKDEGHSDAINKGFKLATGDIYGFLNGDDTFLPGALHRVAREIDPAKGRHIIMGRCLFTDENSKSTGIEHPSYFQSHRRVLEIWKGHLIPQPSTFWTKKVWEDCGPMDVKLKERWVDYDLFVRFSAKYFFYSVDQILATYRLHPESATMRSSESARLDESIRISRRYWGSKFSPMYWSLAMSLALYRFDRLGRAGRLLKQADELWRQKHYFRALLRGIPGSILAPEVLFYVKIFPAIRKHLIQGMSNKALRMMLKLRKTYPQTKIYLNHTNPFGDGWIGPRLLLDRTSAGPVTRLVIRGTADLTYFGKPQSLHVLLDDRDLGTHDIKTGDFGLDLPVDPPLPPGEHRLEILANSYFVPHRYLGNQDFRPLAWLLHGIELN